MAAMARLKSTLDVLSTVFVIVAGGAVIWTLVVKPWMASNARRPIESVKGASLDASKVAHPVGTGPVAIVEFSDFQCPYCGSYARDTWPTLKHELIDSGRARYVAMHFPLTQIHPFADGAAVAAECAARDGRFWEMHDRLFRNGNALSRADLVHHAEAVGLDRATFERCLEQKKTLEKVRADQAEGQRLGVQGTPTFFIGTVRQDGGIDLRTRIRGVVTADVVAKEVEKVRPAARAALR